MKAVPSVTQAVKTTITVIIITFIFLETVLRLYHFVNPLFVFPDNSDTRFRGKPYGDDYDFILNSKGFKDTEFRSEKVNGTRRFVGIGDSFVFGTVPYKYNFLTVFEEEWNRAQTASPIEVFNMGIPGTSPRQYLSVLIKDALPLQPDVALVFIYIGNDFIEIKKPLLQHSFVIAAGKFVLDFIRHVEGGVTPHSRTSEYKNDAPTLSVDKFLQIETGRSDIYAQGSKMLAERLPRLMYFVDEIHRVCKEKDIALYIVLIPDEVQIDRKLQQDVLAALRLTSDELDFDQPNKRLAQELQGRGIKHLDLLPAFRDASREEGRLYIPRNTHWNIEGNRLAAALLIDFLRQELRTS
jgi:hypothetical protein